MSLYRPFYVLVAVTVAAHLLLAFAISQNSPWQYVKASWLQEAITTLLLPLMAVTAATILKMARRRLVNPTSKIRRLARMNRSSLYSSLFLLSAYLIANRTYRSIKVSIADNIPFYADSVFKNADKWIFGTDPWRITHALLGDSGTIFIDRLYALWFPIVVLMYAWAAFHADERFRLKATFTQLLIWIVAGNILATLMSSAGPCYYEEFYGSPYYSELMEKLKGVGSLHAVLAQSYLLVVRKFDGVGTGISAMPSIHVALTTLLVLMMKERFGWRWPTLLACAYLAIILVGSVHLGWHYAVDGIFSLMLVPLVYAAVGKGLDWCEARSQPSRALPAAI